MDIEINFEPLQCKPWHKSKCHELVIKGRCCYEL